MSEQFKVKRFSDDIDKLLNGGDIAECQKAEDDYQGMLGLAQAVGSVDYSTDSKLRQGLLDKLLKKMAEQHRQGFTGTGHGEIDADELDDNELANVAGGQVLSGQEQGCSLCGCKRGAASIEGDTCPDCGHSRVSHP